MSASRSLFWVVPERRGGIHSYAMALWPAVREAAVGGGWEVHPPFVAEGKAELDEVISSLRARSADVVHVQHEFGLFGRKIPGLYRFPQWLRSLRAAAQGARVCATAHYVVSSEFRYGEGEPGVGGWTRRISNVTWVPLARRGWIQGTWGPLDGVIVHSDLQRSVIEQAGCPRVSVIPHFVPTVDGALPATPTDAGSDPVVLVFGYFSAEKGQDVALEAFARVRTRARLVLAGGPRRPADKRYAASVLQRITALGLADKITVTGFLPEAEIDAWYARATLVVAPFRHTTGSGSLVQALARGAAVLASDLPLNRELAVREPGVLAFFRAGDAVDCAARIDDLLRDPSARGQLRHAARRYAAAWTPGRVADLHVAFYRTLRAGGAA